MQNDEKVEVCDATKAPKCYTAGLLNNPALSKQLVLCA